MADSASTRLRRFPGPIMSQRSLPADGTGAVDYNELKKTMRDQLACDTRIDGGNTVLLVSAGASAIITQYEIDLSAGFAQVSGFGEYIAALNDQPILGTDAWAKSFDLAGDTPALLSADGKTYDVALVIYMTDDGAGSQALDVLAVFGDEADDGAEVAPTAQQIRDVIEVCGITDLDPNAFTVCNRLKIQRVAVDTIAYTVTDPATDSALRLERVRGYSLPATEA